MVPSCWTRSTGTGGRNQSEWVDTITGMRNLVQVSNEPPIRLNRQEPSSFEARKNKVRRRLCGPKSVLTPRLSVDLAVPGDACEIRTLHAACGHAQPVSVSRAVPDGSLLNAPCTAPLAEAPKSTSKCPIDSAWAYGYLGKEENSPRCPYRPPKMAMSKAIPCNGVLNSLISKKKSLILENQFPAKFVVLATRFPTTARNSEVLCPTTARSAQSVRCQVGDLGGFREAVSDWFWLFPGNCGRRTGDLAPNSG